MENYYNDSIVTEVSDVDRGIHNTTQFVRLVLQRPQAEEALKSSQRGYEADKVTFLDLLDSVRSFLMFEQEYYRSQADYAQRIVELERVIGVPLNTIQEGESHDK